MKHQTRTISRKQQVFSFLFIVSLLGSFFPAVSASQAYSPPQGSGPGGVMLPEDWFANPFANQAETDTAINPGLTLSLPEPPLRPAGNPVQVRLYQGEEVETATPTPSEPVGVVTERGNSLISSDGLVQVDFAADAVQGETAIVIETELASPGPAKSGFSLIGQPFRLEAYTPASRRPVTDFPALIITQSLTTGRSQSIPYTISQPRVTLHLTQVPDFPASADEQRARLHYWDETQRDWFPLVTNWNPETRWLSASITKAGLFALLAPPEMVGPLVVLDPDHGGGELGGVVTYPPAYAAVEKALNLQIGLMTRDLLQSCGVTVDMTRESDVDVSNPDRASFINSHNPDVSVTIAVNILHSYMSFNTGSGPENWIKITGANEHWGNTILAAVEAQTPLYSRGNKDAATWNGVGLYLPLNVDSSIPHAQAELAFMDNYFDRDILDNYPDWFAQALYNAVVAELGLDPGSGGTCAPVAASPLRSLYRRAFGYPGWLPYYYGIVGDPVFSPIGNVVYQQQDMFVANSGLPWTLERTYNSYDTYCGGYFGCGWSSSLDTFLWINENGEVDWRLPDGQAYIFTPNGDGTYNSEPGVTQKLEAVGTDYRLTFSDQTEWLFNSDGHRVTITERNGNQYQFNYDGTSLLSTVTDPAGRSYTVSLNGEGYITTVQNSDGRQVSYGYDATGHLVGATNLNGDTTTYNYDSNGRLLTITDPLGETFVDNTYNENGSLASQTDSVGNVLTLDYDSSSQQTVVTDGLGRQTTYVYDDLYRPIRIIHPGGGEEVLEYDTSYNLVRHTDQMGAVTQRSYDSQGNMVSLTDPMGATTTYTFDAQNNLVAETDPLGHTTTYSHDSQGNVTGFTDPLGQGAVLVYDSVGLPTQVTDARNSSLEMTYDANGHVAAITDALGNTTTFVNDAAGRVLSITDANGHTMTMTYDDWGNTLTRTDPKGGLYQFSYDANHNLTHTTDPLGRTWQYFYDGQDRLVRLVDPLGQENQFTYDAANNMLSSTDAAGRLTAFVYDNRNNLIEEHHPNGGVVRYEYDAANRVTRITDALNQSLSFIYDAAGRPIEIEDALGQKLLRQYDALGRLTREVNPRGYMTDYVYDANGNVIEVIDALSQSTHFVYDEMGQTVEVTYPDGSHILYERDALGRLLRMIDQNGNAVSYAYDPVGNITAIINRNGHTVNYTYDENNNRETAVTPLGFANGYEYDAVNNLVKVIDANNHNTSYAYDGLNRLKKITNALNYSYQFVYDPVGNLLESTDPLGGVTVKRYDLADNLLQETDPLGYATYFAYDLVGNLTQRTDANGGVTTYSYDAIYQLTQTEDPLGYTKQFTYDPAGNLLNETDENGDVTHFVYDPLNRSVHRTDPRGGVSTYTYDPVGHLTSTTDPMGGVSLMTRDPLGQLISLTDALGYVWRFTYDGEGNRLSETNPNGYTTNYAYNADGYLAQATDAKGFNTQYFYDPVGNLSQIINALGGVYQFEYDALSRRVREVNPLNGVTLYNYDGLDRLTSSTDPRGGVTLYAYDAGSRLTSLTNALGYATTFTYDGLDNQLTRTDANHHTTTYTYDLRNRQTSIKTPLERTTSFTYDGVGNVVQMVNPRGFATSYTYDPNDNRTQITDALGGTWHYTYDLNDNQAVATNPNGHTWRSTYNAVNSRIAEILPLGQTTHYQYDGNRNLVQSINAKGAITTFAYDEVDLLASSTDPLNHVTQYEYDGLRRQVEMTDAMDYVTNYAYDLLDRLVTVTDALGHDTHYDYDPVGDLIRITDANGHETLFEVDLISQVTAEVNAVGSRWEYTFDPVGNLINRRDANQDNTTYHHDADDRLIRRIYPDARQDNFIYDANSNMVTLNDPTGTLRATYDALDRMTLIEKSGALLSGRFLYGYDSAGNLTSLTYPKGLPMRYTYNENEWLVKAEDPRRGPTTYAYDPVGLATRIAYPNGTESLHTYDLDNRITQVNNRKSKGSTRVVSAHGYQYDAVDNVNHIVETFTRGQLVHVDKTYTYDGLGQVLTADEVPDFQQASTVHTEYTYDPAGNRTQMVTNRPEKNGPPNPPTRTIDYTYDDANRLLTAGDFSFIYDANGNRRQSYGPYTSTGTPNDFYRTDYDYDYENRLVWAEGTRILSNGHEQFDYEADFKYDGYNRRVEKGERDQGVRKATGYLYDRWGFDVLAEKLTPGQPLTTFYYRDPVQILSRHEIQGNGSGLQYWYHYDGLRNTVANSNQSGLSVHEYRYEEYGQILDINGKPDDSDNWTDPHNHYLLAGKELDEETELVYFGSRYYDPVTGTWITQDSYRGELRRPLSLHRLAYLENNPTSFVDFYGFLQLGPLEINRNGVSLETESLSFSVQRTDNGIQAGASVNTTYVQGDAYVNVSVQDSTLRADAGITGAAHFRGNTYGINAQGAIEASCGSGRGCYLDGAGRAKMTKNGETLFDISGQFHLGYRRPIYNLLKKGMPARPASHSLLDEVNERFNASEERLNHYTDVINENVQRYAGWSWADRNVYCPECILGYNSWFYRNTQWVETNRAARFLTGVGEGAIDTVSGLYSVGKWAFKSGPTYLLINPQGYYEQQQRNSEAVTGIALWAYRSSSINRLLNPEDYQRQMQANHDMMTGLKDQIVESCKADGWRCAGRVTFEVGSLVAPLAITKAGKAGKLGTLSRVFSTPADELLSTPIDEALSSPLDEALARERFVNSAQWKPTTIHDGKLTNELIYHAYNRHPSLSTDASGLVNSSLYDSSARTNLLDLNSEIHDLGRGRYGAFNPETGNITIFSWQGGGGLPSGTPTIHSYHNRLRSLLQQGDPLPQAQGIVNMTDISP